MKLVLLTLCMFTGMCANDPFYASSFGGKVIYDRATDTTEADFQVSISANPYYRLPKGYNK